MGNNEFVEIDLELLRIDTILGFDLYLAGPHGYILYRSRNVPFNERVRQNLINHGVKSLYMPGKDMTKFAAYIENNLSNIVTDPKIKTEVKCQILYDTSINIAKELLFDPGSLSAVKRSTKIVENMVDLYLKDEGGIKKIIELMPEDYQLYTHSTNVSILSVALGKSLGILNKNELYELGLGALLHDIGKSKIPRHILNKPGPLSPDEFNEVKQHVRYGCYMVENNPVVPRQAIQAIQAHHERLSGKGYPDGHIAGDIPLFGMITGVADSFDAMTSNRVYQKAMTSFKAMEILLSETQHYDRRIVMEMLNLLGPEKTKVISTVPPPEVKLIV
ncbi:MAG: HD domain-containing protein [candidate division Zixibacteria bacterium]|nr:HD domain-containing protein [candidate division Zixibacteria bacterium]